MEPVVNYYVLSGSNRRSIGAAIPMILSFPKRRVLFIRGKNWGCEEILKMQPGTMLEISSTGNGFGLEPETPVYCSSDELSRFIRWWQAERKPIQPATALPSLPKLFEESTA